MDLHGPVTGIALAFAYYFCEEDRLYGLVVRVPGATRFSEK
jgi:hypothetical protein